VISCGLDLGSLTAQAVLVDAGAREVLAAHSQRARPSPLDSAADLLSAVLGRAGLERAAVGRVMATGYGRQRLVEEGVAQDHVSEISCHGAGAAFMLPGVRTVVDIGRQDAKVIRMAGGGGLSDFVMNDKCASGTGRFLEVMAKTLGVELEALGPLALSAADAVPLSARCSIFCETEVLHHLQRGETQASLAAGVCRAMAERVAALVRRMEPLPPMTMTGGVAKNEAVRRELERLLGARLTPLDTDPQLMGALGAALHAGGLAAGGDA